MSKNGLTTGKHGSKEHPDGKAVDWILSLKDGRIDFRLCRKIICIALKVGFRGIGLYYNGRIYQFHFDTRDEYAFWTACIVTKKINGQKKRVWRYQPLFIDPKYIK